jgi:glycosyltransferase involved in cell wall biosynthesis
MRILYIASVRIPNEKASGLAIMRQCEAFTRTGHTVTLLRPFRKNHITEEPFDFYGLPRTFTIATMPSLNFIESLGRAGFYLARLSQMIAGTLRVYKDTPHYDLVYARDPWMLVLLSILPHHGMKLIWEAHQKQEGIFIRFMAKRVSHLVCISPGLVDFYGHETERGDILLEPSGVDLEQFDHIPPKADIRTRFGIPQDARVIAYIGKYATMGEAKGVDELIKAFIMLASDFPRTHLLIVGLEKREVEKVVIMLSSAGIPKSRYTLLPLAQKQFAEFVTVADVLVMNYPDTEHYRNFMSPTKLFAYMAGKQLIVSTDLPSIREIAEDNMLIYVAPDNIEDLCIGIKKALSLTPVERERYTSRAYERVTYFTWQHRANRILSRVSSFQELQSYEV